MTVDTEPFDDMIESFAPALRDEGWQIISGPTQRLEVFPALTVGLSQWLVGEPIRFSLQIYCGRADDPYSYRAGVGYARQLVDASRGGLIDVTEVAPVDDDEYVVLEATGWATSIPFG